MSRSWLRRQAPLDIFMALVVADSVHAAFTSDDRVVLVCVGSILTIAFLYLSLRLNGRSRSER